MTTSDSFSGGMIKAQGPVGVAPSTTFGKYELFDLIAVGGMAEIFLARSTSLGGISRACVIKRILPKYSTDRQFVSMFIDEARITIGLEHPNIVRLFDFGQVDGAYFMAIEYVDGCDLVDVLREIKRRGEGIPPPAAAYLARCLTAGLHHAHEQRDHRGNPMGIVHRDVSPQNLFVGWDGSVKIGDFGIASARNKLTRTIPGTVKGKFGYMSPEQAMGGNLDARADIWAAGVVLHEMLVGQRLFGGESVVATLSKICDGPILRPSERRPGVPEALDVIAMRALTRPTDQRYRTAEQMTLELDAWLASKHGGKGFGKKEFATWLEDFGLRKSDSVRRPPSAPTTPDLNGGVTDASTKNQRPGGGAADEVLRRLRSELRRDRNLWSLVDIAERHRELGELPEALAALRTTAAVFAHRGLLVQAVCAIHEIKDLVSKAELQADLAVLAELRSHDRKRLIAYLHRVDTGSFWVLVQEADPDGLGNENNDETMVRHSTPLFGRVGPEDFVKLATVARVERCVQGATIVREGDSSKALYAVGRGRLVVHCLPGSSDGTFAIPGDKATSLPRHYKPRTVQDGAADAVADRIYLSALADGDFFGEFSFLTGRPRSATVETITSSVLVRIDQNTVDTMLKGDPLFGEPLLEFYKERVAELMMAKNPVFALLSPDDRRAILQRSALKRFLDEEPIVTEGEIADTMFFIKHGEVEIYRTQEGFPIFINKLREGQFFGEVAALHGTPRTASVRAMGEVEVFCIHKTDLDEILSRTTRVRDLFEAAIVSRQLETQERLAETTRIFEGV